MDKRTAFGWVLAAALAGFASSFVLSDLLRFPRGWFVAGHAVVVLALCLALVRWQRLSVRIQFSRRRVAGLVGGVVVGVLLAGQVLGQPASPHTEGGEFLAQLALLGVTYGVVDALLLSVLPVLAVYGSRSADEMRSPGARLRWGVLALVASCVVTAAYHAGFAEFRGPQLLQPIIGNTLITLAYLLTGSPWAPLVAHVGMHGAAVFHGADATMQLPPHY